MHLRVPCVVLDCKIQVWLSKFFFPSFPLPSLPFLYLFFPQPRVWCLVRCCCFVIRFSCDTQALLRFEMQSFESSKEFQQWKLLSFAGMNATSFISLFLCQDYCGWVHQSWWTDPVLEAWFWHHFVAPELENLKSAGDNKTPSPYNTIPQRIGNWIGKRGIFFFGNCGVWLQELEVAQDLSALRTLYEGRSSVLMMMMGYWW